jgi:mRNA-degrading endonuclease RelE of RelBE toxin-antitoxin system
VVFVETRAFSARIRQLLPEEDYRLLQLLLAGRPDAGRVVVATGGIRKIRVGTAGRGRSGGLRVFYYWHPPTSRILFLFVFAKNEQGDLTPSQKADLRRVIETEYP